MYSAPYQPTNILHWFHAEQEQIERERGEGAGKETPPQHRHQEPRPSVATGPVGEPQRQTGRRTATYRDRLPPGLPGGLAKVGQGLIQEVGPTRPRRVPAPGSGSRSPGRQGCTQ